jgi:hypothetical protein
VDRPHHRDSLGRREVDGAGGGSIVWMDPGGLLRVGPGVRGRPGPTCYMARRREPTVTGRGGRAGVTRPGVLPGRPAPLDARRRGSPHRRRRPARNGRRGGGMRRSRSRPRTSLGAIPRADDRPGDRPARSGWSPAGAPPGSNIVPSPVSSGPVRFPSTAGARCRLRRPVYADVVAESRGAGT